MSLFVTQTAANRIKQFIAKDPLAKGFKISIKKTGCSGWGYEVELTHELDDNDIVCIDKGVSLIANKKTLEIIKGTTVDYQQQGINYVFVYNNPNATGECGCGESFTVESNAIN